MTERRRTFGPVVLAGLAATALAAVAGSRTWLEQARPDPRVLDPVAPGGDGGQMPLATALSLVLLACWGVLLVTRRVVRRMVAVLGLLCAVGIVVVVVVAWFTLPDQRPDPAASPAGSEEGPRWTGWFWAAGVGSVGSLVAASLAVAWVRHWPEMGSRYDAPGGGESAGTAEDASSLDLWKAMDEGRDPTT